jgi:hypothetical protein
MSPIFWGYTPSGVPVYDYLPDEPPLCPLLVHLAQPDEADCEAPTALSLPLDAVQEEAPIAGAGTAIGASEAGDLVSSIA